MTPEERNMLGRALQMAEQNNHILRKMRRSMMWSSIFQIIYWLFILGVAVGAYYVIQPYLGPIGQLLVKVTQVTGVKL